MKIVSVCACTSGIAHTYIAKEKLIRAAESMGHTIKVETQGTIGTEDELTAEEIKESTTDYVLKELSKQMKGYPFEEVVANLLQAMGYRTKLSKQGGDHGIDIIAYKDELPPRIVVQVKSVNSAIQEERIQSLKGLMHEGDYSLP